MLEHILSEFSLDGRGTCWLTDFPMAVGTLEKSNHRVRQPVGIARVAGQRARPLVHRQTVSVTMELEQRAALARQNERARRVVVAGGRERRLILSQSAIKI